LGACSPSRSPLALRASMTTSGRSPSDGWPG
jgi:hypothetical protein